MVGHFCNSEFERMWVEARVVYFKVRHQNSFGGAEEGHEKPVSGPNAGPPRYEVVMPITGL